MANRNKETTSSPRSWPAATETRKGKTNPMKNALRLDRTNGKLMGVCSGLANWSGVDVTIWRIGFVAAALFGIGAPILIYLALGLIID